MKKGEQQIERTELIKAVLVGIVIDAILLAIVGIIDAIKEVFIVVAVVVAARWIISIGLAIYRRGNLNKSELHFVRFGPLAAIWCFLMS